MFLPERTNVHARSMWCVINELGDSMTTCTSKCSFECGASSTARSCKQANTLKDKIAPVRIRQQ